jgi:hypothetical protein
VSQFKRDIDKDSLREFIKQTGSAVSAGFNCAISVLGDRLGLFRAMAGGEPVTSEGLARQLDLHERWVREWLYHQACVGQVNFDEDAGTFHLSPEAEAVLVDSGHPAYLMGAYDSALAVGPAVPRLEEAFRTGLGMSYDEHGPSCACGIERMGAFAKQHRLVPEMIPLIPGLHAKLEAGAAVADVGCGGALSTIAMAQAFPQSEFIGYDTSEHALDRARGNVQEIGLANVRLANPFDEPLPKTSTFDLVTTFDVIHDTPYPAGLIADIHSALKDDGHWLCEDIKGYDTFPENLREHPMAGLLYGFSVTVCMNSAMSTADGAGLGTLGFTTAVAKQMTSAAGFSQFTQLELDSPLNNYYAMAK